MNIVEDTPRAVPATSGALTTQTYYANKPLKVGDLVELSADGLSVSPLASGSYAGLVLWTANEDWVESGKEVPSQTVCVVLRGRIELSLGEDLLSAPVLSLLKATKEGFSLAKAGEVSCAYLVKGDTAWTGTGLIELFYPTLVAPAGGILRSNQLREAK